MKVIRTLSDMQSWPREDVGFVPTMGAFHEGHLRLMKEARSRHSQVCVSLFVNPLQFGKNEDLSRYPRDEARDFRLAEAEGVDYIFAPDPSEIYPRLSTTIHVPEITTLWEGSARPGHFDGVATVVAKLFNIVKPDAAYFGWKDLQQCLVVKRMTEDLNLSVRLVFLDTMREPDGLAMSSRNRYLNPDERRLAPKLYEALNWIAQHAGKPEEIDRRLESARRDLTASGFAIDYLEMVSMDDLKQTRIPENAAIIVAAKIGTTRLIDNLRLNPAIQ